MSPRLRALRVYALVAVVPPALAFLAMDVVVAALLSVMWVVLVGTIAVAVTSQGSEKPNTWDRRGRLHG